MSTDEKIITVTGFYNSLQDAKADVETLGMLAGSVITSYSIHYTKLYEAGMKVTKNGDSYLIIGSASGDIPLGFELILEHGAGDLIHGRISDLGSVSIREKTNAANPWYSSLLTATPRIAYLGSFFLIVCIPILLLA